MQIALLNIRMCTHARARLRGCRARLLCILNIMRYNVEFRNGLNNYVKKESCVITVRGC